MNDRFKFRVWDKGNKRYQESEDWQPYLDMDGDVCFINVDDVRHYPPENYFIIEQCTCLKDKNGNLIYEGDVVKEPLLNREYIIKWDSDNALFEATAAIYDTEFEEIYGLYADNAKKLEITGNIHEQPEQKDVK